MQRLTPLLPALALLVVGGCALPDDELQPADVLRFPSDLALSEDQQVLYVVDSNFDLEFDTGVLHAVDLAALQAEVDGASAETVQRFEVPWVGGGGVQIGSFGGRPVVARRADGGERVFVPIRGGGAALDAQGTEGGEVAVVDRGASGLMCHREDPVDCRRSQVVLATPSGETMSDPYAGVVLGDSVWISALTSQAVGEEFSGYHLARLAVDDPDDVTVEVLGNVVARDMTVLPGRDELVLGGNLVASVFSTGVVRSFDPSTLGTLSGTEASEGQLLLQAVMGADDVQDIEFSADGSRLWVATRAPSAVVGFAWDGVSPLGEATHLGTVLVPDGAARLAVMQDGDRTVLAVTSVRKGTLSLVDADRMRLVGVLDGTACADPEAPCPTGARDADSRLPETDPGERPLGLVSLPVASGGRLVVAGFERGRLSVVDVPDLSRPWEARVRATFESPEGQ